LAKFDVKVRHWRTLGPQSGDNGSRPKNRTEHNSVESFLALKNVGFAPFRSEGAFVVRKNRNEKHSDLRFSE
jgi:hypothetical protein